MAQDTTRKARLIKRGTQPAQQPTTTPAAQPRTKTPAELREQWQREREQAKRPAGKQAFVQLWA